jgi:hypothetical protein
MVRHVENHSYLLSKKSEWFKDLTGFLEAYVPTTWASLFFNREGLHFNGYLLAFLAEIPYHNLSTK